jgi:MerR family transcriptional regulator/heat shock protein HspR
MVADRHPRTSALGDAAYPSYTMAAAADAISVTPAFLRSAEAAGLFEPHRSDGGHRRYSRDDLERADRARALIDEGLRMDAAVRIIALEYQLAATQALLTAAEAMIHTLQRRGESTVDR